MKRIAQILSTVALVATILPPLLFFGDKMDLPTVKSILLAAAVLWLAATPFWMEHKAT
jgi:hypothetical protein